MAYEKTWQFDTNRQYIPADVLSPVILTCVFSPGGGSLATTEYWYAVTATKNGIESITGGEFRIDSIAGGTITLTWTAVAGATSYKVYRGGSSKAYTRIFSLGNVQTYTDNGTINVVPASPPYYPAIDLAKYTLWYYKAFLTGQIGGATLGLWTVAGSSDAINGAMDGVDRWTSTYVGTKIVNNTAGTAHSWMVLRSPIMAGQTYYILMDYNSTTFYNISISLGVVSAPTGGTWTTAPTVVNAAPLGTLGFAMAQLTSAYWPAGTCRFHGQLATDGSFNILSSRNHTRKFISGFMCHVLGNYRVTDLFPVLINMVGDTQLITGYGGSTGAGGLGPDKLGISAMRTQNNSNYDLYAFVLPNTSNWPDGKDRFDMSFADYPLWVAKRATGNGFIGVRGRLQDVVLQAGGYGVSPDGPEPGSVDSQFSTKYVAVGTFRFPIDQQITWD